MDDLGFGKAIKYYFLFLLGICLVGALITELFLKPMQERQWEQYVPASPWKNEDPNRPVTDIADYDYENQTVTYREYGNREESDRQLREFVKRNSETVVLETPNGAIDTGLSSEEILEQLELDYHDAADYLGDELQ